MKFDSLITLYRRKKLRHKNENWLENVPLHARTPCTKSCFHFLGTIKKCSRQPSDPNKQITECLISPANTEMRDKLDVCAAVFTARTFMSLPGTDLSPCQELRAQKEAGQCHQMGERRVQRGKPHLRSSHPILQGGMQWFPCENRNNHAKVGWNHSPILGSDILC